LRRSSEGWQRLDTLNRGRERWAFDERVLGSSAFVTRVLNETLLGASPPARTADPETTLRRLLAAVAERFSLSVAELCGNSHRAAVVGARSVLCYSAMRYHGLSPTSIAKYLAITRQSVARAFQRAQHPGEHTDDLARSLLA
jgi:chromosomal replication initiation ATPase DnaA